MSVPVIKATKVERTPNASGGFDVTVHVPILGVVSKLGLEQARKITGLPIPDTISSPTE